MNEIDKLFTSLMKTEEVLTKVKRKNKVDNKVVPISIKNFINKEND